MTQGDLFGSMSQGATISPDGLYRTALWREWAISGSNRCVFVMLNPSKADADIDDPTIRRCIAFAQRWGHDALDVVNLFSWRATSPMDLLAAADPVSPEGIGPNAAILEAIARSSCRRIVCAWGSPSSSTLKRLVYARVDDVRRTIDMVRRFDKAPPIECLGFAKDGMPRHPLYLAAATELRAFPELRSAVTQRPNLDGCAARQSDAKPSGSLGATFET